MAKMTKTQYKNAYKTILSRATKVWRGTQIDDVKYVMSTTDYIAIEKIVSKYMKKF